MFSWKFSKDFYERRNLTNQNFRAAPKCLVIDILEFSAWAADLKFTGFFYYS